VRLIKIRVSARASRNQVVEMAEGEYRVYTTAPALEGKANDKVRDLLAEYLKLPFSRVQIVKGETSRDKWIEIGD